MQLVISALPGNTPETPMITLEYSTAATWAQILRCQSRGQSNRASPAYLQVAASRSLSPASSPCSPALLCLAPWKRLMVHCHLIACRERVCVCYGLPSNTYAYNSSVPRLHICPCDANMVTLSMFLPRRPLARNVIPNSSSITFRGFDIFHGRLANVGRALHPKTRLYW